MGGERPVRASAAQSDSCGALSTFLAKYPRSETGPRTAARRKGESKHARCLAWSSRWLPLFTRIVGDGNARASTWTEEWCRWAGISVRSPGAQSETESVAQRSAHLFEIQVFLVPAMPNPQDTKKIKEYSSFLAW